MFKKWLLIHCLFVPMLANAQFYEYIPVRGNDPFVFCTEGPFYTYGWSMVGGYAVPWPYFTPDSNYYLWLRVCVGGALGGAKSGGQQIKRLRLIKHKTI
jgi:hypothetical protein